MHANRRRRSRRQQGVSLIEALVALAVMAIGMLGIVGIQTTLRANADVAKQRSEALRIAQREVEAQRSFVSLNAGGAAPRYADIASSGPASAAGVNATFWVTRTVTDLPDPLSAKALKVQVAWDDRTNNPQQVQLSTVIAGVAPQLAGTMVVGGEGDFSGMAPKGRNRGIPLSAKDLGNGTSGFMPPGAPGGLTWVFNNTTGVIRLCATSAATTGDLDTTNITCGNDYALLVAGYIHYSLGPGPMVVPSATVFDSLPTEASTLVPYVRQTQPDTLATNRPCYTANYDALSLVYYCAPRINPIVGTRPTWSGDLRFIYLPALAHPRIASAVTEIDPLDRKACRFHEEAAYAAEFRSRQNQNYLLIRAGDGTAAFTCPTPTLAHQPVP